MTQIPEGFVLVPREPTKAMVTAAEQAWWGEGDWWARIKRVWSAMSDAAPPLDVDVTERFRIGARVEKKSGSSWRGVIVGSYSTILTPIGWAVESENEPGSVQIYPEKALRLTCFREGGGDDR